MDENFDHNLVVSDTKNRLYSQIVNRREGFTSTARFIMQLVSFFSFIASLWLLFTTRDSWYIWAVVAFFLLTIINAQILNYRLLLDMVRSNQEEDDYDELDDLA
jgi:hypothetical protein